jgi:hypothetical protein
MIPSPYKSEKKKKGNKKEYHLKQDAEKTKWAKFTYQSV